MLDITLLRKDLASVVAGLEKRKSPQPFLDVARFSSLESERRTIQVRTEELQARRNSLSKQIGQLKAKGDDTAVVMTQVGGIGDELKASADRLDLIQTELSAMLMSVPNLPRGEVPVGCGRDRQRRGAPLGHAAQRSTSRPATTSTSAPHSASISTPARCSRVRASASLRGPVARLHRALAQFMLDVQTLEHGYTECYTPYIVNREILEGTGQLPKFKEDMFWVSRGGDEAQAEQYLISTSEISLTNTVRERVLPAADLPIKLTAHSPCFRSEAGSAGRDTRGMIRQHQFDKVEMVQITRPGGERRRP